MGMPITRPIHDAPIYYPTSASVLYEPGDLLYQHASGHILPASSQADQTSESANQVTLASLFVGICNGKKLASDTGTQPLPVIVNQDVEMPCESATFIVGDYVGGDEMANGTQLERQQVKKVSALANAIGVVTEHYAAATTKVWFRPLTKFNKFVDLS